MIKLPLKHIKTVFAVFTELEEESMEFLCQTSKNFLQILGQPFYKNLQYLDTIDFDDIKKVDNEQYFHSPIPCLKLPEDEMPLKCSENKKEEHMGRNINIQKRKKQINSTL